MNVTRRRFMILLVTLVALNSFFWLAGGGMALTRGIVNQFFGNKLIRAEVVLQAPGGTQDWLIDRGVVTAVSGSSITVREADGRIVSVSIDPNAPVQGPAGRVVRASRLRTGLRVVLYHQANQAAELVQVEG
jgi:hypothetical protein